MLSKKTIWISAIILTVIAIIVGISIYFANNGAQYYIDEVAYSDSYPQDSYSSNDISPKAGTGYDKATRDIEFDAKSPGIPQSLQSTTTSGAATASPVQERLIIKTGNFSIVVDDVKAAIDKISNYANQHNGFVTSSSIAKYGIGLSGNITIRIPSKDLDQAVSDLKAIGEVTSESIYGNDVTEEYVDLDSRLKNLKATEAQFLEIMKQAVKIEDVLAVEKELSNTRAEIESITGRIKYLKDSSDLSTLSFYISTNSDNLPILDKSDSWKPLGVLKEAFRSMIDLGKGLGTGLIWAVAYLPIAAILGLIIWWIVRVVKKHNKKR